MFGAFIGGYIGDIFGRKNPTIFSYFLISFSWISNSFSNNYNVILICCFFAGIAIGIFFSTAITLIAEIFPCYLRGKSILFFFIFFSIGGLYTIFVQYFIFAGNPQKDKNWKTFIIWNVKNY